MSDYAPEIGPDGRERPKFGEYATPEEQRARIQQPDAVPAVEPVAMPPAAPLAQRPAPVSASAEPTPPRSQANRLATIMLLAFGAANVMISMFSYLDLTSAFESSYEVLGITEPFTNYAGAKLWGTVAAIVLLVGYLATLMVTWRVLKAGRISWWIPLVGAVVTFAIVCGCIAVPLMGDAAFTGMLR